MRITTITMSLSETIPLKQYASLKPMISETMEMAEGDDEADCRLQLRESIWKHFEEYKDFLREEYRKKASG